MLRLSTGGVDRYYKELFEEAFADPFEAVPAAEEDEAADILIKGEDCPHCYESPAESPKFVWSSAVSI